MFAPQRGRRRPTARTAWTAVTSQARLDEAEIDAVVADAHADSFSPRASIGNE
jgi:hypothetical protein